MAVSLADITKLRKMTGAGMMDCKNALAEAEGDIEKAIEVIRKKGQAFAAKRSDREAAEGCVLAGAKDGFAAIVAIKCETDFVAINADFVAMTKLVLDAALANQPKTIEELAAVTVDGRTIAEIITDRSGITGEKMELGFYEIVEAASTVAYIHPGNKLATIVAFNQAGVDTQVAKDVAMQVAAMNPVSLSKEDVPAEIVEKELSIGREKAREEGKPENMLDKIAQGRLNKFYQDSTLLAQAFIKDGKVSVADYMNSQSKGLTATAFKRVTLNVE
ncbi:MAG: translation elongation factor Ts [Bacteroidota bacterium]|uniref:translation elongation factor Ts n=1 Tax=Parabacteroides sp. FAFU027 TaxID=2922715 RepID=UPI001FB000D3|nr:translation elongation factor Ts [Parabacteroides sp. FAFU027]MDP4268997.1 translation elongation factor Ts [Bacteroidota bacterium]